MKQDLFKICADSLRTFSKEKYDIKLKAAHAHELVAAYFGYKSKNAMLADTKYPMSNLNQTEIIVMMLDSLIDQRRKKLQELPSELPDSYTLGEAVYTPLFSDEWWTSPYPPFRSFKKMALFLIENNDAYNSAFKFYKDISIEHIVNIVDKADIGKSDSVSLLVFHAYEAHDGEKLVAGQTSITLPRVAGHIGYGHPNINVQIFTGGMKVDLEKSGAQLC